MPTSYTALDPANVWVRHVKKGLSTDAGAIDVCGTYFVPQDVRGINGPGGWTQSDIEERLGEEGTFNITFPNDVGGDGFLHRDRFLYHTSDYYRPGDEWLEFYRDDELLYVGTPTKGARSTSEITLSGSDGLELMKKARESLSGYFIAGPRDIFEAMTTLPTLYMAEDFAANDGNWFVHTTAGTSSETQNPGWITLSANQAGLIWIANDLPTDTPRDMDYRVEFRNHSTNSLPTADGSNVWLQIGVHHGNSQYPTAGLSAVLMNNPTTASPAYPAGHWVSIWSHTNHINAADQIVSRKLDPSRVWPTEMTISLRGRFAFYFVDGEAVGCSPLDSAAGFTTPQLRINLTNNRATAVAHTVEVHSTSLVARRPFMLRGADPGDRRLASPITAGGLLGTYKDARSLGIAGAGLQDSRMVEPTQEVVTRRVDPAVAFGSTNFGGLMPISMGLDRFLVRWTGAIYLDLAAQDITLTGATTTQNRFRIWVGKTYSYADLYLNNMLTSVSATGTSLRTFLGTSTSGWYPIIVECFGAASGVGTASFTLQWNVGGAGITVPTTSLSPQGIYENQARLESAYEVLRDMMASWAIQARVAPRQLESGEFPGQLIPRVREGRDTELIVDALEGAAEARVESDADEVADLLLADIAGLGADNQQVTVAALDILQGKQHFMLHADQASSPDLGLTELVSQRIRSLQTLRSSPWEQVSVRPRGMRDFVDSFPLTGSTSLFDWKPGDGVRLSFPELTVEDATPRQITGVKRQLSQGGVGNPDVSFRQRPRSLSNVLRDFRRDFLNTRRNFQGTVAVYHGSPGVAVPSSPQLDTATRLVMPEDLGTIVRLTFVVTSISGITIRLEVGSVSTGITTQFPGRYDVTQWAESRPPTELTSRRLYGVGIVTVGSGNAEYMLEAQVLLGPVTG